MIRPKNIQVCLVDRDEKRCVAARLIRFTDVVRFPFPTNFLLPTAHHDFGYSELASRSINFCIYLNEGMRGGETSFPRWRNAETKEGMNMVPEKGKAMIFYMVNPDGNLDDLTQHAALPVLEGEKWFSNLWIWDPFRA